MKIRRFSLVVLACFALGSAWGLGCDHLWGAQLATYLAEVIGGTFIGVLGTLITAPWWRR
jgi:hypothetical protein